LIPPLEGQGEGLLEDAFDLGEELGAVGSVDRPKTRGPEAANASLGGREQHSRALYRAMAPARDKKQWRDACKEVGLDEGEMRLASEDFHVEKRAYGERVHWSYGKLIIWLRAWREDRWRW
jgi:hypothetical protein